MKKLLILIMILLPLTAFSEDLTDHLLKKVDELYRSKGSIGKMEMEVITPDWSRTVDMDIWTKGMDYTFIRINKPRKDKGVSSLKRKNEMWNFFPKINKVIKVPPSMMMGSWMGSDFTNDDLVKDSTLLDDYTAKETAQNGNEVEITLYPKTNTVSLWGKIVLVMDKKSELPLREEYFDERGEKIRILYFKDVKNFGGKIIPSTMELKPLTKEGHKTIIRYVDIRFDVENPQGTFTLTNLQRRR